MPCAGCRLYAFLMYFVGLVGMGTLTIMSLVVSIKVCRPKHSEFKLIITSRQNSYALVLIAF